MTSIKSKVHLMMNKQLNERSELNGTNKKGSTKICVLISMQH